MLTLQFVWRLQEGSEAELTQAWRILSEHVEETEPGVLVYSLSVEHGGKRAHVLEVYEDVDALVFHSENSSYFTAPLRKLRNVEVALLSGTFSAELEQALRKRYPKLVVFHEAESFARSAP